MEMKTLFLLATTAVVAVHAADPAASSAPSPAKVTNPVKEADLTTITLTAEATQRLGIAVVPVEKKRVSSDQLYGGEITLPLAVPKNGDAAGALFALAPPQNAAELLKLAELQAAADGEVEQARVKVEATKLAFERAEKLLASQTGSERAVEEARAAHQLAKAALEQATAKRALLGPGFAAAPDGKRWWVRVPIFASDIATLDGKTEASVKPPGAAAALPAQRVANAPPTATAVAATVDWYFELNDPMGSRRPGERVEVRIPLAGAAEERLVLPWAAVVHDIHGGQWVYEATGPNTFVRRRVQVARVAGTDAVLATGPAAGTKVVTTGAAELFGIEFGPGK